MVSASMRALAGGQDRVRAGEDPRPVRLQRVEGAGGGETFDDALVDRPRIDARGEVGERGEQAPLGPLLDDLLDRLDADALERGERVVDDLVADLEGRAGAVDVRRLDLDAEALRLGAEFGELVGVVEIERHRRRDELHRIMRLHVGGVVGHQRIGRRVALVEAVVGEFRQAARRWSRPAPSARRSSPRPRRRCRAACPSRRGSSCPWRGATGRRRRANSPTSPARSASPVPGR